MPTSLHRARLVAGPLLALIASPACRSRSDPAPLPEPPATASAAASSSASSAPAAAAAPAPDAGPGRKSPTLADLRERHVQPSSPWPSGPGVQCGEARCAAGELCCDGGEDRRCLPRSKVKECLDASSTAMQCDESSDCGAGQICCFGVIYEKEAHDVSCKTPAVCARPLSRPGSFPIPGRELCARGGACRDRKLVCIDDERMPSGGACVSKVGSVSCLDHGPCPADRPWCLWDPGTRTAECIPRGSWGTEDGVNQCDGPEDCVGEPCSTNGSRSFCSMDCTVAFRFANEACHKDSDCLDPPTISNGRSFTWKCVASGSEDALPGIKVCAEVSEALR